MIAIKIKQLAILVFLFVCIFLSTVMMQLVITAENTILNASFYDSFVQEHNLGSIPQNYVLLTIKNNISGLDEKTYQSLIKTASNTFSEDWTKKQVSGLINNLLTYLKNTSDELDLRIDFREQKSLFVTQMISTLTQVSEDDTIDRLLKVNIAENISNTIGIPDYLDLRYTPLITESGLMPYIDTVRVYYPFSKYIPFMLFILLSLSMLFLYGLSNGLENLGRALAASGLAVMVLISYGSAVLDATITTQLSSYDELLAITGNNPKILASIFKNSILSISNRIAIGFCVTGIVLFIAGILTSKIRGKSSRISQHS